jgi:hypothetical protein
VRLDRFPGVGAPWNGPNSLCAAGNVETGHPERLERASKSHQRAVPPRRKPCPRSQPLSLDPIALPDGKPQPSGNRRASRHGQPQPVVGRHPQHIAARAAMAGNLDRVGVAADRNGRRCGLADRRERQPKL